MAKKCTQVEKKMRPTGHMLWYAEAEQVAWRSALGEGQRCLQNSWGHVNNCMLTIMNKSAAASHAVFRMLHLKCQRQVCCSTNPRLGFKVSCECQLIMFWRMGRWRKAGLQAKQLH